MVVVVALERPPALGEVLSGGAVLAVHLVEARGLLVQPRRLVRPLQVPGEERGALEVLGAHVHLLVEVRVRLGGLDRGVDRPLQVLGHLCGRQWVSLKLR